MYLLCSDWSIRSLEKEKEKEEKEEENCHLFITARRTDEGRDKNINFRTVHKVTSTYGTFLVFNFCTPLLSESTMQVLEGPSSLKC